MRFQVKKVVAVCLLEAVKTALDHIGHYRLEGAQRGVEGRELTATYGDLRRLRDYLQRCVGSFPDVVTIDVIQTDLALLVACCRRCVEVLDTKAESRIGLAEGELEWLTRKRSLLMDWTVELAQKPLVDLPLPRVNPILTPAVLQLQQRLRQKLYPTGGAPDAIWRGNDVQQLPGARALGGANAQARATPADGAPSASADPAPAAAVTSMPDVPAAIPHPAVAAAKAANPAGDPALPAFGEVFQRLPSASVVAQPATAAPAAYGSAPKPIGGLLESPPLGNGADLPEFGASDTAGAKLIDPRQLRDMRLRALIALDLRAFDRAVDARDHRLAAVHLSSVLECALLDHAIPRRRELDLQGGPESWSMLDVLIRVLGEGCTPRDRSLAFHAFAAKNLIRPTAQLLTPTVVTPASVDRLVEFTSRVLRMMGFGARSSAGTTVGAAGGGAGSAAAQAAAEALRAKGQGREGSCRTA